jgi:acyl-CoA synthetase (AMP-forming)/AMP-acid ligase II
MNSTTHSTQDIIIRGGENLFPVQIENALTSNSHILEAAVVSVPDKKYGEVVGAWIRPKAGVTFSRESVRKIVWESMNPQVCVPVNLGTSCDRICRTRQPGFGSLGRMALRVSSRRRRVGRCRNIF